MAGLFASIGHNLTRLARFSGRDTPAQFWPYGIATYLLSVVAGIGAAVPMLLDLFERVAAYMRKHPEGFPPPQPGAPPALPPEMMPDMSMMLVPSAILNVVTIALLAAAAVRRLHDRDRSGWWFALPLPFQAASTASSFILLPAMMAGGAPDPMLNLASSLSSLAYWGTFIYLIVLLAGVSAPGPNRFGPDPQGG